ncbi:MAG: OmpA family protein [Saprospiraceae bacterium]
MKTIIFILTSVLFFQFGFSQNLVVNPSFENLGKNSIPEGWEVISPTVDVLQKRHRIYEMPSYKFDEIYSKYLPKTGSDGKIYINLYKQGKGTEAISTRLKKPLVKDSTYLISARIYKPYNPGKFPCFEMGVLLTQDALDPCSVQQCFEPPREHIVLLSNPHFPILIEGEWIEVYNTYKARGGEQFLTLCYPKTANIPISQNSHVIAYCFDEVSVQPYNEVMPLYFDTGVDTLDSVLQSKLSVTQFTACDSVFVRGFASSIGNSEQNWVLAKRRAENTANFLKTLGITEIKTENHGEVDQGSSKYNQRVECVCRIKHHAIDQNLLYEWMTKIDNLERYDQMLIEKHRTDKKFENRRENYVAYLVDSTDFLTYKWDVRTEQKFTILYLHTSESFQISHFHTIENVYETRKLRNENFAYIIDRHNMYINEPQVYGTQFLNDSLYEIENRDSVNFRRVQMNLEPIEDYIRNIRKNK